MIGITLVSVIIPAFNASDTLQQTLLSVSAQTYRDLEILVVDDGSVDQTAAIAGAYTQTDPRVRLLRQPNTGVAAARNAGIQESRAEFVAFIDADDIWHPTKIAKQMALLTANGDDLALVYTPFRRIDMDGMVLGSSRNHRVEGWVVNRHFYVNFVGNGSSILVRKHVLEQLGGYSPALRQASAQGCEDLLLQLRIALRYRFGSVPEYLVGYRQLASNMSSNPERMLRSSLIALTMVLAECPSFGELEQRGLIARNVWEYLKLITMSGNFSAGLAFIQPLLKGRTRQVFKAAGYDILSKQKALRKRIGTLVYSGHQQPARNPLRHFDTYDPADMNLRDQAPAADAKAGADIVYRKLAELSPLDALYRPEKYFDQKSLASFK